MTKRKSSVCDNINGASHTDTKVILDKLELSESLRRETKEKGPMSEAEVAELDSRRNKALKKRWVTD